MIAAMVVGTRPQLLKAAFLRPALEKEGIEVSVNDTRQHYSRCMAQGIEFNEVHEAMLSNADACIIIGDTDSSAIGATIASMAKVPIVHIEAGLRCFDPYLKEERNRIYVDGLSDLLLCSSTSGVDNLHDECISNKPIKFTGDLLLDMVKSKGVVLSPHRSGTLMTLHRQDTVDNKESLSNALAVMRKLAVEDMELVLHPRTFKKLAEFEMLDSLEGISLTPPLQHDEFLRKLCNAKMLLTDSGGAAREAFFVGQNFKVIRGMHEFEDDFKSIESFGDGHAAENIAAEISRRYA